MPHCLASFRITLTALLLIATADAFCDRVGGFDLNDIPTFSQEIGQSYEGFVSQENWVLNLCQPINEPFRGATPCTGRGFIAEYNPYRCQTFWNQLVGNTTTEGGLLMTYAQKGDVRVAQVTLSCGPQLALQTVGDVLVEDISADRLMFHFHFTTSAVCPPA